LKLDFLSPTAWNRFHPLKLKSFPTFLTGSGLILLLAPA